MRQQSHPRRPQVSPRPRKTPSVRTRGVLSLGGIRPNPQHRSVMKVISSNVPTRQATWRAETLFTVLRASLVVLVGASIIGGVTSPAQGFLPDWLRSLANSAGGWSMFTFLLVWLSRARPLLGAILGVVAFEAMLEAYALVSLWRGNFYAEPFQNTFTLPGIAAGLVLGAGAALVRHAKPGWLRVAGVAPLCLVLALEGIYGLTVIASTTSPVYWILEILAGLGFLIATLWRSKPQGIAKVRPQRDL
jgi:hypothetical protein